MGRAPLATFTSGLHEAFDFAIIAMLVAAAASWLRGKHTTEPDNALTPAPAAEGPSIAEG